MSFTIKIMNTSQNPVSPYMVTSSNHVSIMWPVKIHDILYEIDPEISLIDIHKKFDKLRLK